MSTATLETRSPITNRPGKVSSARAAVEALLQKGELESGVRKLRDLATSNQAQVGDILRLAEIYTNVGLTKVALELLDAVKSIEPLHPEVARLSARLKVPTLFRTEWQLRPDNGRMVTRQDVEGFFAQHFDIHDWYYGAHFDRLVETLMRTAAYVTADSRVLEAGSNGSIPLLLWKLFGVKQLAATDDPGSFFGFKDGRIVRGQVPELEFSLPIVRVNLETQRWPFEDGSKDVILSFETLEHFREDPMFFMIEANRVLKPNGLLILTTPNSSSLRAVFNALSQQSPLLYSVYCRGHEKPGMGHVKEYAVRELQQLFQKSGFCVDNHQTFSPYKEDVDGRVPGVRDALLKLGLSEQLSGSTHFIVGRKQSVPACRVFKPLYEVDEAWSGWPSATNDSDNSETLLQSGRDAANLFRRGPRLSQEQLFARYKAMFPNIGGWLHWEAVEILRFLNTAQVAEGITGNLAEIGAYRGKLSLAMATFLNRDTEVFFINDIFDNQELNTSNSGGGANLALFSQNFQKLDPDPHYVRLLIKRSDALKPEDLGDNIRFFSVDGGHSAEETCGDMVVAARALHPKGMIVLDDYYNPQWPGVEQGVKDYFSAHSDLAPLALFFNKFVFVKRESLVWFQQLLQAHGFEEFCRQHHWSVAERSLHGFGCRVLGKLPSTLAGH